MSHKTTLMCLSNKRLPQRPLGNTKSFPFKEKIIMYEKVFVSSLRALLIDVREIKVILIDFLYVIKS